MIFRNFVFWIFLPGLDHILFCNYASAAAFPYAQSSVFRSACCLLRSVLVFPVNSSLRNFLEQPLLLVCNLHLWFSRCVLCFGEIFTVFWLYCMLLCWFHLRFSLLDLVHSRLCIALQYNGFSKHLTCNICLRCILVYLVSIYYWSGSADRSRVFLLW